jgi:hypothetical protein
MKRCNKCGEVKDLSGFTVRSDTGKPLATCKACRNIDRREDYQLQKRIKEEEKASES